MVMVMVMVVLLDFEHGWERQRSEGMKLFIENC